MNKVAVFITCTECHKDYHEDEICSYCGLCDNCCHCYSASDYDGSYTELDLFAPVPTDGKTCIRCGDVFPDGIPYTCPICDGCPICCARETLENY